MPLIDLSSKGLPKKRPSEIRELTYRRQREQLADRILEVIKSRGLARRGGLSVADIGCGNGDWLRNFQRWDISRRPCGVDLDPLRIGVARRTAPDAVLVQGDCRIVPFRSSAFDVVTQFTLFSSLMGAGFRQLAAKEMLRMLKPGGLLIWYDFFAPNPLNRRTRPIRRSEIKKLFPNCAISLESTTLLPPLARLLCRFERVLPANAARQCARIPWLRTHYLAVIEKPSTHS
jgi:ubiquinone/menaquinone biosynthesis C-methylase UbiE